MAKKIKDTAITLYNEVAEFYDKKRIGIEGLWQLHFFIQAWLNSRHEQLCAQDSECAQKHPDLTVDISKLESTVDRFMNLRLQVFDAMKDEKPNDLEVVQVYSELMEKWIQCQFQLSTMQGEYDSFIAIQGFHTIQITARFHRWTRLPKLEKE